MWTQAWRAAIRPVAQLADAIGHWQAVRVGPASHAASNQVRSAHSDDEGASPAEPLQAARRAASNGPSAQGLYDRARGLEQRVAAGVKRLLEACRS